MQINGRVVEVYMDNVGSVLAADALAGATEISVVTAADFDENGGQLTVVDPATVYTYVLSSEQEEFDVLTITPGLASAFDEGSTVSLHPYVEQKIASVRPEDDDIESDSDMSSDNYEASISPLVADTFALGDRPEELGEYVLLDDESGEWEVVKVYGQDGTVPASSIVGTVPSVPVIPPPPDFSPDVVALGGKTQITVRWASLVGQGPFMYEVHMSTAADFIPGYGDTSTLVLKTAATAASVANMPGGIKLAYDTTYYFRVIGSTEGGAADPGLPGSAQMDRLAQGDLAANSVTAVQLSSIIALSTLFRTAETGSRVEIGVSPDGSFLGVRIFDSAGVVTISMTPTEALFAGKVAASFLSTQGAELGGITKVLPGASVELSSTVLDSPGLPLAHEAIPLSTLQLATGATGYPASGGADYWWQIEPSSEESSHYLRRISLNGLSGWLHQLAANPGDVPLSAVVNSGHVYQVIQERGGTYRVRHHTRSAPTTIDRLSNSSTIPDVGIGGYAAGEPVISVMPGPGDVMLAHRVQGAQTISGMAFADQEVLIRRITYNLSPVSMTLTQTVKTGLVGAGRLRSLSVSPVGNLFDLTAVAGSWAFALSGDNGFGTFGVTNTIRSVVSTGAAVTAANVASGASNWYGGGLGMTFDGTAFWQTTTKGDSLFKFSANPNNGNNIQHAYTYTNGTQETKMSPLLQTNLYTRYTSRWSIPPLPLGMTKVRLYLSQVSSPITRFQRVGEFTGTAGAALSITQDPIAPPAGDGTVQPPAISNLSTGSAAQVKTSLGSGLWKGDNSGRIGPLSFTDTAVINMQTTTSRLLGATTTTTTLAYVALSGSGHSFVAPPSGAVTVEMSVIIRTATANIGAYAGFQIRAGATVGSGTVFQAPVEFLSNFNTGYLRAGASELVEGLTPGATYNVQSMIATQTAGTSATSSRATFVITPSL